MALEQLSFADCIRHEAVVMDVATTEAKEGGKVFSTTLKQGAHQYLGFSCAAAQCVLAGPSGLTKRPSWAPSFCCSQSCKRGRVFEIDIGLMVQNDCVLLGAG